MKNGIPPESRFCFLNRCFRRLARRLLGCGTLAIKDALGVILSAPAKCLDGDKLLPVSLSDFWKGVGRAFDLVRSMALWLHQRWLSDASSRNR